MPNRATLPRRVLAPLLLATAAQAQVRIVPRVLVLQSGQGFTFHARSGTGAEAVPPWRWSVTGGGGRIDPHTGAFTADVVADPARVRVRAEDPRAPGTFLEATVTVLPDPPFGIVSRVLGEEWLETFSLDLPFRDPATGLRPPGCGPVREDPSIRRIGPRFRTGHGLPCALAWTAEPAARGALLSIREDGEVWRRDVTGQDALVRVFHAPVHGVTVESLEPQAPSGWRSRTQVLTVDVRGVFPLAGNPLAEGGHQDGRGLSARFREAFQAAAIPLPWEPGQREPWGLVVTDPASHVLRHIAPGGEVSTLCGGPGRAGHQDSPGTLRSLVARFFAQVPPEVRFNRPTYLVHTPGATFARPFSAWRPTAWDLVVSDSGNHALRRVEDPGQVDTLAGVPGMAGHRDADDPREALFNDPRGLATNGSDLFVADRGNHVIRRIHWNGWVSTLAGSPGQAGDTDGAGAAARFSDLRGLAIIQGPATSTTLYVLDGHALRTVHTVHGQVRTLLGQAGTAGFQDLPPGPLGGPAAKVPCLRDPTGLHGVDWQRRVLFIADRGNHAVRQLDLRDGSLRTLAGDPAEPRTRWGLVRDGIPGPLDSAYAALEGPTGVAQGWEGAHLPLQVCAGRAVAEVHHGLQGRVRPRVEGLASPGARRDQPCRATFQVTLADALGPSASGGFRWTVDFLDPGGALAERHQGTGRPAETIAAEGGFTQSGQGTVRVRCVTDEGVSAGATLEVPVEP